ncbi:hypothetical protein [Metapseudomonas otitidis]|uniref:hypothetical protein n=1 Tax=Metapseudomonas otitidis TaxID=319939 RepID=UPI001AAF6E35|nr:hypothetical protein [Pseudomonas otitidis]MBO2927244.1 hypothetical protein [Pseudomonas otitidis]
MNETAQHIISGDFEKILIAVVAAALTIIAQVIITLITKKSEFQAIKDNFKDALRQHELLTEKSGRINHHFNREALAYQIKLNHYETKSTEAIVMCYERLISMQGVLIAFIASSNRESEIEKVISSLAQFRNLLLEKKIWLPLEVLQLFTDIQTELQQNVAIYERSTRTLNKKSQPDEKEFEAIISIQGGFYDYVIRLSSRLSNFGDELAETIRLTLTPSSNSPLESPPTDSHTPAT